MPAPPNPGDQSRSAQRSGRVRLSDARPAGRDGDRTLCRARQGCARPIRTGRAKSPNRNRDHARARRNPAGHRTGGIPGQAAQRRPYRRSPGRAIHAPRRGSRTALPRQQTLRALIGWSYDLLTDAERSMLRQLAVFHGSCTLDAVMEVCIDEHSADWDVLQGLESLVEKSLLVADVANAEPRYRMLESTREYALERLREAGDYEAATTRHCAYFVRESERRFDEFWQVNLDDWNAAVRPDLDNFRSAITRALENDNDLNSGVLLAANLVRVNSREFREILIRAATTDTSRLPERTRARLALALAIALIDHRSFLEHAFAAVESLERIGSRVELADARLMEAVAMFRAGRNADLAQHAEATLALTRASGAPRLLAYTQGFFGCWLILRGDRERGLELLDKAVRTFRSLGDKGRLSLQLINYADALFSSNDVSGALDNAVEALELCMERGDTSNASRIHINMSGYLLSQDHAAEAWICVREGLQGAVAL